MNGNLYAQLAARFSRTPEAPCLDLPGGARFSYADLERETARYANLLVSLGLERGDRVAVQVDKSPQVVFLYLGCLRAGFVYLPLNTAYREGEVSYFLGDAEPRAAVCRSEARAWFARVPQLFELDASGRGSLADAAANQPPEFDTVASAPGDLASIIYTSGTTGRSKGAMVTHGNLVSNALALHRYWRFRAGDVLLHALPLFHVHGLFVALHTAMLNASRIVLLPRFEARQILRYLPQATVFMGVPTYYLRLLAEPGLTRELCAGMRLFVSGSAPLLTDTFNGFRSRTGHTILERYGMTETGMNTSNPYEGERRGGTVGFPLPGIEVRVVDDADLPLLAGKIGHIQVRGPNVLPGYWKLPEKNKEEFTPDGFFRSGDLGTFDADGYLSIVGRSKDLVISGGFNVYPKEIEMLLDEHPGVEESAVIGLPHPDFGEVVTAVVVARAGAALTEESLIAHVKGRLANFKVPKRVFIVRELPRNAMGKVQKNALRATYGGK
ncbi:MAG: malonyl-CoA synthase [Betaproteobacteria bacterium]|nr:malonyl-CoA synthase [Betaproteobacteria bacterium]